MSYQRIASKMFSTLKRLLQIIASKKIERAITIQLQVNQVLKSYTYIIKISFQTLQTSYKHTFI